MDGSAASNTIVESVLKVMKNSNATKMYKVQVQNAPLR